MHPRETKEHKGLCPGCGKAVTVGVMARVEELADNPEGRKSPRARPYTSLIPLPEIIADSKGVGVNTKNVQILFMQMLSKLGNELFILREVSLDDIARAGGSLVAEGVRRVREGKVNIAAGYDGEYGVIHIFDENERTTNKDQLTLFAN